MHCCAICMRRCVKFNAVGHDKRVMEEVGNIM